jgi:hypothetical protein
VEPVTTSSQLLLWEAIDQAREAAEGPELPLDDLAECVMALLGSTLSLQQISEVAEGLLRLADHPGRPPAARPIPLVDVQAVLEKALDIQDWQELEEEDDRCDNQKLIDNATHPDTVLVRDPAGTPELQEIGILELLQRYPCRGSEARWSPDEAIGFLEPRPSGWMRPWRAGRPMARPWLTTATWSRPGPWFWSYQSDQASRYGPRCSTC